MPSYAYAHNYTALIVYEHTYMIDMSLMGGLGTSSYAGSCYSVYPAWFIAFLSGHTIMFYSCSLCFIAAQSVCMIACVYSCISSSAVCVFVLWSCLDIRRRSRCFPTMPMGFPRPTSRLRYRKISALPLAHLCNYHCKSVDLNRVNM